MRIAALLALLLFGGCRPRIFICDFFVPELFANPPLAVASTLRDNGELYVVVQPAGNVPDLRFYRHDRRRWTGPVVVSGNRGLYPGQLVCGLDERGHVHVFAAGATRVHVELDRDGGVCGETCLNVSPYALLRMSSNPLGDLAVEITEGQRRRVLERPGGGAWTERPALTLDVCWTHAPQRGDHKIVDGRYAGPAGTREFAGADHVSLHLDRLDRPRVLVVRDGRLEVHVAEDGAWRVDSIELPAAAPVESGE